jgi:hypothetical protein
MALHGVRIAGRRAAGRTAASGLVTLVTGAQTGPAARLHPADLSPPTVSCHRPGSCSRGGRVNPGQDRPGYIKGPPKVHRRWETAPARYAQVLRIADEPGSAGGVRVATKRCCPEGGKPSGCRRCRARAAPWRGVRWRGVSSSQPAEQPDHEQIGETKGTSRMEANVKCCTLQASWPWLLLTPWGATRWGAGGADRGAGRTRTPADRRRTRRTSAHSAAPGPASHERRH